MIAIRKRAEVLVTQVFVLSVLVITVGSGTLYAQAGGAGLSFLKLGTSARGIAMADAMSAHVTGSAATYYNPAGLPRSLDEGNPGQILLMHKEWIQDTRTEVLAASVVLSPSQALGFSVNSTTVSDIEIRTRPGPADGTFDMKGYAVGLSYSQKFSDVFAAGITGKYLYEKILVDDASGFAFDLGAQYKSPIPHLSIGAVIANLGSMSALRAESTTLPTLMRIGAAYDGALESISSRFLLATDVTANFPAGQTLASFGGELEFQETVAVRSGYVLGSEGRGFSAGIGVRHGILGFDYAYVPLSSELGTTHTFSLFINL